MLLVRVVPHMDTRIWPRLDHGECSIGALGPHHNLSRVEALPATFLCVVLVEVLYIDRLVA